MNIRMGRPELVRALYRVQGIADRRATQPMTAHVLLDATQQGLAVSATDGDLGTCGRYDAEVQTDGRVAVKARQLYDVVKSMSGQDVTLQGCDNHWVDVRSGNSHFHLAGLEAEEFPALPEAENDHEMLLPKATLQRMVDRTLFCVSNDENRHNLGGVFCEAPDAHILRLVSTDGHRLALSEARFATELHLTKGALVPRKALVEMRRLMADAADDSEVRLSFSNQSVGFGVGKVAMVSRLIDGRFPDYRQVIPKGGKEALIDRQSLVDALKRVSLLCSAHALGVRFDFDNERLQLTAEDPEAGDAQESVPLKYDGDPLVIGFNARYVLDVLALIDEPKVAICLIDTLSPGLIKPEEDKSFVSVVMPMRI